MEFKHIDIPSDRDYDTEEDARLDESLINSIQAARDADNQYLAQLLENELGSHYYETR